MSNLEQKYQIIEKLGVKQEIKECENPQCKNLVHYSKHAWNKKYCSERCALDVQHEKQKRRRRISGRYRFPDNTLRFVSNVIKECYDCGSEKVIYDFIRLEIVCANCGLVVRDISR
jgi:hypothetical protein